MGRVALVRVLALILFLAATTAACWNHGVHAAPSELSFSICRTHVSPCQRDLSIPVGDAAALDLVVQGDFDALAEKGYGGLLAWETHVLLSGDAADLRRTDGLAVQERGEPELALSEISPLTEPDAPSLRYFTVQNRYDTGSGQVDYAVALIGPESPPAWPGTPLAASGQPIALGRIHLEGLAPGSLELSDAAPGSQMVLSDANAGRELVRPTVSEPLATLRVGPVTTPGIVGKVELGLAGGPTILPFPAEAEVSLWKPGAVPPWRSGFDAPVARFVSVALDANGQFRVPDIPASLAEPGPYDVRVKVDRAIGKVIDGMVLPGAGETSNLVLVAVPPLSYGDADGDNAVNGRDLEILRGNFILTSEPGEPGGSADFNYDRITDVADFSVLATNFGALGD